MSAISNNTIARAIYLATKDKSPKEQSMVGKQVIEFLSRRGLMNKASAILEELKKIVNQESGVVVARIRSAENLGEKIKKEIMHDLQKRYSAAKVVLEESLDKRLLGGFRVEVNDEVIDLSVKNKIGKLQAYLTRE